ncbi:hypothetical protein MMC08_000227 [Hypocenomyce scalaris]|nr:hypothetical protein [Hypocenomyce scalaris]
MSESRDFSFNDTIVLTQLFDPETAPTNGVVVDPSLPSDPVIRDADLLSLLRTQEKDIIRRIEATCKKTIAPADRIQALCEAHASLSFLIDTYPDYASLRNNRAQLLRLQYGDSILVSSDGSSGSSTEPKASSAGTTALEDLDAAITLLTPAGPQSAISPAQGRTLAQAYTQRAALLHATAKILAAEKEHSGAESQQNCLVLALAHWNRQDFEEAASRDFYMGGRYGNQIGKALAVRTSPTAKLCGQMVQQAMKREFLPEASML